MLLAALIHAALLLVLTSAPHSRVALPSAPPPRITLLLLPYPAAPLAPVPLPAPAPPVKKMAHRLSAAPALERAAAPLAETVPVAAAPVLVDELAPLPAVAPSAAPPPVIDDMMRRARGDIAAIARDFNKDRAGHESAFSSAMQEKLARRFAEAHAAARTEWYQAAKIEEITTAGSGGARIYRITTAIGAFCMTYPSSGGRPTYSNCGS